MPTKITQDRHLIEVKTDLGKDVLILTAFTGTESVNDLFHFTLEMLSDRRTIDPMELNGTKVSFAVGMEGDGERRWFNGVVSRFGQASSYKDEYRIYRAQIVPWLWLLSHRITCRIFQEKSVKDIINEVFQKAGMTDFEWNLRRTYEKRDYTVQYLESDLDFVLRLLEDEGIFYFFKHQDGKHTLVMGDHAGAYYDMTEPDVEIRSHVPVRGALLSWQEHGKFQAAKWAHKDYNFKTPSAPLLNSTNNRFKPRQHGDFEVFDFPGGYFENATGQDRAKVRASQLEANYRRVQGTTRQYHFAAGGKCTLKRGEDESETGTKWVCTAMSHSANDWSHMDTEAVPTYDGEYEIAVHDIVLSPTRRTKRPVIPGAQTARVVGSGGKGQIYTDRFGRVKVKFHWDRASETGNDTCWIRCVQPWAGPQFGMAFTPRIGMEVMVLFVDGDPDHPIIVGCIFNGENMPHHSQEDSKERPKSMEEDVLGGAKVSRETVGRIGRTDQRDAVKQSGLMSRSVGSTNPTAGNAWRIDDTPGEEEIYFHAQKDMVTTVENDDMQEVERDRKKQIGRDEKEKIGRDLDREIVNNKKYKVGNNEDYEIGVNFDRKVGMNQTVKAGMTIVHKVGASKITIDNTSITLESLTINLKGQAMIDINAPMTMVKGTATLMLKGGIVLIN